MNDSFAAEPVNPLTYQGEELAQAVGWPAVNLRVTLGGRAQGQLFQGQGTIPFALLLAQDIANQRHQTVLIYIMSSGVKPESVKIAIVEPQEVQP